jgi:hypothetical protein
MLNLTPALRKYAAYRTRSLDTLNPHLVQEQTLFSLLKRAQHTKFGLDHGFSSIKSVADYQQAVPLRLYEDFWYSYWQPSFPRLENSTWPGVIPFFCVSSGTSAGSTKNIPCTKEMLKSNTKAGLDLLCWHLRSRPSSNLFGGSSFFLGGSTDLIEVDQNVFSGDLSGIQAMQLPWWAKSRYFPPQDLALLANWEEKIEKLAETSLKQDIRLLGGVPSWLLILMDRIATKKGLDHVTMREIFPTLEILVHGGVNFGPYKSQFDTILAGSRAETREVYPASEGFIAIADRGSGEGLRVNFDHNLFFEFVPLSELTAEHPKGKQPTRHWIGTIEKNIQYAVVLTTCAGLWSYILGDTVTFVETTPPRLLITGRTSYTLSAFGEHLIGIEIEESVTKAAEATQLKVVDYSVGPVFPATPQELGGHLYVVEFTADPTPLQFANFLELLDKELSVRNEDYHAHRANGFGLCAPKGIAVTRETFKHWMQERGKLGGQNKVPRIINSSDLFSSLQTIAVQRKVCAG